MANIKSQIKRNRQTVKRSARNKAVRSDLHTTEKKAVAAIGTDEQEAALRAACSTIDKAAKKGVIHPNKAARKKSRLTKATAAGS
ncbi:MAG: 30S ribosomal protein S20 [Acidimicrobiales bacterium]